jgi:hypothetical protein
MSPEEVIGMFVSFELMIKGSKQIIERGATSTPEVQPVAFKAMEEKKEESTSSRLPIDASKLDNEEMALIIKSFRQILKQRKGKDYKPRSKKVCYKCGKPGHFIAKCPMSSDSDRDNDKRGKGRKRRNTTRKRAAMPMFAESGTPMRAPPTPPPTRTPPTSPSTKTSSSPTSATSVSWQGTVASTKYATSSDEDNSSDDEDNLFALFANLNMQQKEKLNELIGAIHDKDELLDSQEDFLIKENKKHVKVKNAYAL